MHARDLGDATLASRGLVFDCDGVLIDSDGSVVAAWTAWALARDLDPADVIAVCHGQPARSTVRAFVDQTGAEEALADIDRLELELAGEARALPGSIELLHALPDGRWACARPATGRSRPRGSPRRGWSCLRSSSPRTTSSGASPTPEGYTLALARLGATPSRSVVVEDAPNGVAAARAAGVGTVIGVGERAIGADVDAVVEDLRGVQWAGGRLVVRGTDRVA